MRIPVIYSKIAKGKFYAGRPVLYNKSAGLRDMVPFSKMEVLKPQAERAVDLVVDVASINQNRFNSVFVEKIKIPGNDVWLMEAIRTTSDVLDAFMGSISKLLIPCQTIRSWTVLSEAFSLSEDCIPTIVCHCGQAYVLGGRFDVDRIVEKLLDIGYHQLAVLDLDAALPVETWKHLADMHLGIIPYNHSEELDKFGFLDYAVDPKGFTPIEDEHPDCPKADRDL